MNLHTITSVLKSKGIRYIAFRTSYELCRKCGIMKLQYPTNFVEKSYISLADFRKEDRFFFISRDTLTIKKQPNNALEEKAKRILKGEIPFFSHSWMKLGVDYDWITNPETGYKYDIAEHWTQVEDIDPKAGDIKFVWEKSRFSWLAAIMRYDYHFNKDHSEFVISQMMEWIEKNPLNCGPNYKCSQEISIRLLNWIMLLYFYKNSEYLTEKRFQKIINSIYWQIKHIEKNINFSRICVRNNHAITETLTLYLTSLMLPWFPGAAKRKRNGKRWFEQEIAYQIANDGTFIQNSMNYHRVVIQLLSWAIVIADANHERYSEFVYEKALKSVNFLFQCQENSNGWLPNYGANDGALFFQLNDNDYRDYRPQLDALHWLLTGKNLYTEAQEDYLWYQKTGVEHHHLNTISKQQGIVKFEESGYYLFREKETLSFIRCGGYICKVGGNDSLHLDIWNKGENILVDAGSYKYNTSDDLMRYFSGNESHNTVMLDYHDFMQKGVRFIWNYPTRVLDVRVKESYEEFIFSARIKAFRYLAPNIIVERMIRKKKGIPEWQINDKIENKPVEMSMRQLWHILENDVSFESDGTKKDTEGKASFYYGEYTKDRQIEFNTKGNQMSTIIRIR